MYETLSRPSSSYKSSGEDNLRSKSIVGSSASMYRLTRHKGEPPKIEVLKDTPYRAMQSSTNFVNF